MAGAGIYLAGTAATFKDIQDGATYDPPDRRNTAELHLLIMMIITQLPVAALVIVGTGAVVGRFFRPVCGSYLLGIQLHWIVLALAVIPLLAAGRTITAADFRFRLRDCRFEHRHHLRWPAPAVVTAAGLVFAATSPCSCSVICGSSVRSGPPLVLGCCSDTLVRAFMTPSIAVLLGRWFCGRNECARPASRMPGRTARGPWFRIAARGQR